MDLCEEAYSSSHPQSVPFPEPKDLERSDEYETTTWQFLGLAACQLRCLFIHQLRKLATISQLLCIYISCAPLASELCHYRQVHAIHICLFICLVLVLHLNLISMEEECLVLHRRRSSRFNLRMLTLLPRFPYQ